MSDSYLAKEDLTKKIIDEKEMTAPIKEVVEAPIFLEGRDECSPLQDQTEKSSGWYSVPKEKWRLVFWSFIGLAIVYLIPG
jgi:hypothetical protein